MAADFYMLFETPQGVIGLAWSGAGVCAVAFPEPDRERVRARLLRKVPRAVEASAPPEEIERLAADIAALLSGRLRDLSYADLDMGGLSDFDRAVYGLTLDIAPGETRTYGDLARALGDLSFSQRVGQALGRNPFPIVVPCHRVVGANGAMTGFSAPGGAEAKRRLLKIEGAIEPELFD